MAESYRLWVKYPAVRISALVTPLPGDFASGEHGILWLDIGASRWFAVSTADAPKSAELCQRQFGAQQGTLSGLSGGNIEMWADRGRVGVFDLATLKRTNLEGVIATKMQQQSALIPGTGVWLFTEGVYFSRPRVWSDQDVVEKFTILLERAKKHASGEVSQLLVGLLRAVPLVVAIILLLAALGVAAGPVVAGVIAVIAGLGGYMVPRSMEYADQLGIVNEVMNSSAPHDSELEQGARALAEFFRMVLEDCAFALALKAGEAAVSRVKGKLSQKVVETVDEAFTRHQKEEWDRAAAREAKKKAAPRAEAAQYTAAMMECAHAHAFQRMPLFRNRKYAELKDWLLNNGFIWQKQAIFDKSGRNSNAGGSEIYVRQTPEMAKAGLCEAVRIDRAGHDVKFKDGPVREQVNTKTGELSTKQDGWGGLRHFHKDVVPTSELRRYCEGFVPDVRSVNDFGNLVDLKSKSLFQQIHVELKP